MSTSAPVPFAIIESPYAGDVRNNKAYARAAMRDALFTRGVNPYASHLLLTQVLDDTDISERALGIQLGTNLYRFATKCMVYADRGISAGMKQGIAAARSYGVPVTMVYIFGPEQPEDVELVKPDHLILA